MKKLLIGIALISTLFLNACSGSLTASILNEPSVATDEPQELENEQKSEAYKEICSDVSGTIRELKEQKELFKSRYTNIELKQRRAENSLFGSREEGLAASAEVILRLIRDTETEIQRLEEVQKNLPCPTGGYSEGYFDDFPEERNFCKNLMDIIKSLNTARGNLSRELSNEQREFAAANFANERSRSLSAESIEKLKEKLKEVETNLKEALQAAFSVYLCKRSDYHNTSPILLDHYIEGLVRDGVISENDLPAYTTDQPCEFYLERINQLQKKLQGLDDFFKAPVQKELDETIRKFLLRCKPKSSELNLIPHDLVCDGIVERALAALKEFQKSGSAAALIKFEDLRNIYYEYCVGEDVPYFDDDLQLGLMDLFVNGEINREELGEYSRDDDLDYPLEKDCAASKQDLKRALRLQQRAVGEKKQKLDQEIKDLLKRIKKLCPKDDVGEFINDLSDEQLAGLHGVTNDETIGEEIDEREKVETDIALRRCEDIKDELADEMFTYARSTGLKKAKAKQRMRELIDAYTIACEEYEDVDDEIGELISENDNDDEILGGGLPELYEPEDIVDIGATMHVTCTDINTQLKKVSSELEVLISTDKLSEQLKSKIERLKEQESNLKKWKAFHCTSVEREPQDSDESEPEQITAAPTGSINDTNIGLQEDSSDASESSTETVTGEFSEAEKQIIEELEEESIYIGGVFADLILPLLDQEDCLEYLDKNDVFKNYTDKKGELDTLLLQLNTPRFRTSDQTAFGIFEKIEALISALKDEFESMEKMIESTKPCPPVSDLSQDQRQDQEDQSIGFFGAADQVNGEHSVEDNSTGFLVDDDDKEPEQTPVAVLAVAHVDCQESKKSAELCSYYDEQEKTLGGKRVKHFDHNLPIDGSSNFGGASIAFLLFPEEFSKTEDDEDDEQGASDFGDGEIQTVGAVSDGVIEDEEKEDNGTKRTVTFDHTTVKGLTGTEILLFMFQNEFQTSLKTNEPLTNPFVEGQTPINDQQYDYFSCLKANKDKGEAEAKACCEEFEPTDYTPDTPEDCGDGECIL
jgi:hypothetical protein